MDFAAIGDILLKALTEYGPLGVITIGILILVFKFGNQLAGKLADKAIDHGTDAFKSGLRKKRKDSIFKCNRLLSELIDKLDADRASIFEFHNGGSNLSGLSFLHFTLMTLRNSAGVDELSKDFENVLVSSVPEFMEALDKSAIYAVSVDYLKTIYPRLYRELEEDGMKQAIFSVIEGSDELIGFLMLAFKNPMQHTKKKIDKEIAKKVQKMAILLNGKK